MSCSSVHLKISFITTETVGGYGSNGQTVMIVKKFFLRHPIFTISEFTKYLGREEKRNLSTRDNLLAYHVNKGHLLRVKQGLYVVVLPGVSGQSKLLLKWPFENVRS